MPNKQTKHNHIKWVLQKYIVLLCKWNQSAVTPSNAVLNLKIRVTINEFILDEFQILEYNVSLFYCYSTIWIIPNTINSTMNIYKHHNNDASKTWTWKEAGTFTIGLKLSKVKLVEDERQIFYKVEVLVSSVVFKMMTSCQLAF